MVDEINVQPGDRVARGAILARLHSHVVHDAWANHSKAKAERKRVEAELAYARTAEARAALLVESRALSPQELERARADVNTVVQAMASVDAEITRAEQELGHYGVAVGGDMKAGEDTSVPVRAPFAGTVIERQATQGSAVTPGTPLVVISDLSRVWITAEVDEAQIGRVVTGAPVTMQVAAYPGESFSGRLAMVGDVVNAATRRVTLRVEAENPDQRLKPQMFVTLALGSSTPRRVLVVPSRAVQQMEGETVVFVRSGTDQYSRRSVTTGTDVAGEIEIVKGLDGGRDRDHRRRVPAEVRAPQARRRGAVTWASSNASSTPRSGSASSCCSAWARSSSPAWSPIASCRSRPSPISPTTRSWSSPRRPASRRRRWSSASPTRSKPR